jgi:hypothetical protein
MQWMHMPFSPCVHLLVRKLIIIIYPLSEIEGGRLYVESLPSNF